MNRRTRIAIIGAGLGGMTLAGLLQRAGFFVKVYEQAPAFSRVGAGIHLSANVMLVMRRLGIEERLSQVGLHPEAFVSRKWDSGDILFSLPLGPARDAYDGAPYINVHRADLHDVLHSALEPETIAFGKRLEKLEDNGSTVRLAFADGDVAEADVVVGADGVNSVVRRLLFGAIEPRFTGHVAHRAIFPSTLLDGVPTHACTKWWGNGSHILVYYMTQTREEVYVVTSVRSASWDHRAPFVQGDPKAFRAAFAGYHSEVQQIVAAAPEITVWPVFDLPPQDHWCRGRAAILGDAAHAMKPYMAAGAAMAIEDGAVLARCITKHGDDDPHDAFAWYEANRRPRVEAVYRTSDANTWMRDATDPDWLFTYDACAVELRPPRT